jgi:hypothetical protein
VKHGVCHCGVIFFGSKISIMKTLLNSMRLTCIAVMLAISAVQVGAHPLRLLVIGNSFSENATRYLPDLAASGGHELIIARAQKGGSSLEQHWRALAAALANDNDSRGKIYKGKSLLQVMGATNWDMITIQQYSWLSGNPATYIPFATNLVRELKKLQPNAEVVIHETWPYRSDAKKFGLISPNTNARSQREMWEAVHRNYWNLAGQLHAPIIPTGDAFWRVDSDPQWGFKPVTNFDAKLARPPFVPDQNTSLNLGYYWKNKTLVFDSHHANTAGQYLGALVWYGFLFKESPENLTFVPKGIKPDFAAYLRKVAWEVVSEDSTNNFSVN